MDLLSLAPLLAPSSILHCDELLLHRRIPWISPLKYEAVPTGLPLFSQICSQDILSWNVEMVGGSLNFRCSRTSGTLGLALRDRIQIPVPEAES